MSGIQDICASSDSVKLFYPVSRSMEHSADSETLLIVTDLLVMSAVLSIYWNKNRTKTLFNVHESLHRESMSVTVQQGATIYTLLYFCKLLSCRSQWPRGLRRRSAAVRLLRLWVRIPPGAWIFVCCECCVLSGRGLCDELITSPEESYRLWCVVVFDLETS